MTSAEYVRELEANHTALVKAHNILWREYCDLKADNEKLRIAINGCQCPAPYTECPHDEPFLAAVNRLTADNRRLRDQLEGKC